MDRLSQLRVGAGGSGDSTLDTSSLPSEAFISANESSSKYFSLSEVDSTFDISMKDVSLASASGDTGRTVTDPDELISELSPISKKSDMYSDSDNYKIGKQIEAANILSGGVDIFEDNDNSYDGDELVIDDNAEDEKSNHELKITETTDFKDDNITESTLVDVDQIASKDTEVVLQIDGKNVDAIDIGNGIYLYRKEGQEELAAVQIIDDDQHQPSFKFLKVRENAEGNLEVYEEIEIEVPKEVPAKEGKSVDKKTSHVPIKDINKVINDPACNKVAERKNKTPQKELSSTSTTETDREAIKEPSLDSKPEVNLNGKMMKFSESRKSPVIGSFTPITYHSTPNKEGIPLTKTMVDQQLHPSRHSDNKKTIEVHTDSSKKLFEPSKKDLLDKDESEIVPEKDIEQKVIRGKSNKDDENKKSNRDQEVENKDDSDVDKLDKDISRDSRPIVKEKVMNPFSEKTTHNSKHKESTQINLPEEPKMRLVAEVSGTPNVKEKEKELSIRSNHKNSKEGAVVAEKVALNIEKLANKKSSEKVEHIEKDSIATIGKKAVQEKADSTDKTDMNLDSRKKISKPEVVIVETKKIVVDSTSDHIKEQDICKKDKINIIELSNEDSKEADLAKKLHPINESDKQTVETVNTLIIVHEKPNDKNTKVTKSITEKKNITEKLEERQANQRKTIQDIVSHSNETSYYKSGSTEIKKIALSVQVKPKESADIELEKEIVKPVNIVEKIKIKENTVGINEQKVENTQSENQILKLTTEQIVKPMKVIQPLLKKKAVAPLLNKIPTTLAKLITNVVEEKPKRDTISNVSKLQPNQEKVIQKEEQTELVSEDKTHRIEENKQIISKIDHVSKSEPPKNSEEIKINLATVKKLEPIAENILESKVKKGIPIPTKVELKPLNNNHAPVPFGQWTEANRQDFLNKIKETKAPVNSSNGKQIKNSNDLNRRDVLKKIDSQRQSSNAAAKAQDTNKVNLKNETVFTNKTTMLCQETKNLAKTEALDLKHKTVVSKKVTNQEVSSKVQIEKKDNTQLPVSEVEKTAASLNVEVTQKKDFVISQDIIDITIEDMIQRKDAASSFARSTSDHTLYDDIERKMNELHGIPFVERPTNELPQALEKEKPNKNTTMPNLKPISNTSPKKDVTEVDSEEEIIEHEPITGDIALNKEGIENISKTETETQVNVDAGKKEAIITENDFDKFVRRNSVTYENCLTVKFDGKEPHNVIQTVIEKDTPKTYTKKDMVRIDTKSKLPQKNPTGHHSIQASKHTVTKIAAEDPSNKHYQSKLQIAYQSALTAKRQMECPITIIEDKPVKVVFMDSNSEFIPSQLNVQGKELSPAKKTILEIDSFTTSTGDSLDSDIIDSAEDGKSQDDNKTKTKHQRKQVLTPVEAPDLELIQPGDLGIEVSPKKKRKTEDNKYDKYSKNLVHKKSYLLGRTAEDKMTNTQEVTFKETSNNSEITASAIDSLVKAAELLENQSELINISNVTNPDSQQSTPVKRGRGRPRKYPLPEGTYKNKVPSPQKKPRLIDARPSKRDTTTEEEESTDDEIIKENWTMGKINENIVCPICNKLFRSENVVFKHVKHCTGVSPSRSDSEKRSPRRIRLSQESESKSEDMDIDDDKPIATLTKKETPKKRKSKDSISKSEADKYDIIVIEDTPVKERENKEKLEKGEEVKKESKKTNTKIPKVQNLVCEFCGKTFRQLSYLVSHKLQHKKEEKKANEKDTQVSPKSVFSCEVCKKEFRKLHHLVQHRIIHNPNSMPSRVLRKSSSEKIEGKAKDKEQIVSKQSDDPSAGFRCEPCDKSFRKLHHLVEHRETHDGINRQKTMTVPQPNVEKPTPPPECDVCKKTFRKLHHLIEHKEQHNEISSDKSDDKSVKSALSTKDIIHECPLCYMVFPNEHSLNRHTVICQTKKKKLPKQPKSSEEGENINDATENKEEECDKKEVNVKPETHKEDITPISIETESDKEIPKSSSSEKIDDEIEIIENPQMKVIEVKSDEADVVPTKTELREPKNTEVSEEGTLEKPKDDLPEKIKKLNQKVKIHNTPKKKIPLKEKVAPTVTKRQKTTDLTLPVLTEIREVETSDDDEVRYMLNPDFKDDTSKGKLFMTVRAKKRNSLQIERPNSKDLVKRRTSLQHPPKIPRLKPKPIEIRITPPKPALKAQKLEPVPSTDSDDSDVKYSFPKPVEEKPKPVQTRTPKVVRMTPKRLSQKRKSLSTIAKRKSLGKVIAGRHKVKTSPMKYVRRRTMEVEHRCDCGQLFNSAALLSRHTTLAHTPPRIRKRRSPPPEIITKTTTKPTRKSTEVLKPANTRKSSVRSESSNPKPSVPSRKSSVASEFKSLKTTKRSITSEEIESSKAYTRKSSVASEVKPSTRKLSVASEVKLSTRKSSVASEVKPSTRKSSVASEVKSSTRKSSNPSEVKSSKAGKAADKADPVSSTIKLRRSATAAHRGVPVPEKMRKLMQKPKK